MPPQDQNQPESLPTNQPPLPPSPPPTPEPQLGEPTPPPPLETPAQPPVPPEPAAPALAQPAEQLVPGQALSLSQPAPPIPTPTPTPPAPQPTATTPVETLSFNSAGGRTKTRKKGIFLKLIVVIIVLGLAGGAWYYIKNMSSYSIKDLKTYTSKSYSYAYPKQWQDAKNSAVVQQAFAGLTADQQQETSVFAQNLSADGKHAEVTVFAMAANFPVSDAQLQAALNNPTTKQQFESELTNQVPGVDNGDCQSLTDKSTHFDYNTPVYTMVFNFDVTCNYTAAKAKEEGTKAAHLSGQFGVKNSKAYVIALTSNIAVWHKNQNFFKTQIIDSLKPV